MNSADPATIKVEAKLTEWMRAYERLKEAQAKFKATPSDRHASKQLREEIDRLRGEAEVALKELQEAFDAARTRFADPSSSAEPPIEPP